MSLVQSFSLKYFYKKLKKKKQNKTKQNKTKQKQIDYNNYIKIKMLDKLNKIKWSQIHNYSHWQQILIMNYHITIQNLKTYKRKW